MNEIEQNYTLWLEKATEDPDLTAELQAEGSGVTWKDGGYMGFEDFMKKAKEKDGSIYLTAEEKDAAAKKEPAKKEPSIVGPTGGKTGGGKKYVPPKVF